MLFGGGLAGVCFDCSFDQRWRVCKKVMYLKEPVMDVFQLAAAAANFGNGEHLRVS